MADLKPLAICILVIAAVVGGFMYGQPIYNVWHQHKAGEAELAKAESTRRILVETARAKADAAEMEAQAEITRAKGVAEANKIIGESLKDNESYLRYLWINGLDHESAKTIVYVPTECGLPILESSRHLTDGAK